MADDVKQRLRELSENLALTMAEGGMQRSTARVLAALLFSDQETMTAADLCAELGISSKTVGRHLENVFTKLDVTNRAAAARHAPQHRHPPTAQPR